MIYFNCYKILLLLLQENGTKTKDLKIYEMHVTANITNRFSHTLISSRVKNFASEAKEASFSVVLPETAYISGFVLEVDGKQYQAYIKEKEEAKEIYQGVKFFIVLRKPRYIFVYIFLGCAEWFKRCSCYC